MQRFVPNGGEKVPKRARRPPILRTMDGRAGFSLVELLVALMLFTVAGLAAVWTLTVLTRINGEAWRVAQAVAAAEAGLERLRATCADSGVARLVVWPVLVERAGSTPRADTIATAIRCG